MLVRCEAPPGAPPRGRRRWRISPLVLSAQNLAFPPSPAPCGV